MNEYKFSSKFDCSFAHIGKTPDGLSIASTFNLDSLKPLLPSEVSVQDNPDMMFFVANSALINIANKNSDAVGAGDAVKIHSLSKYKFMNLEHKRNQGACGVIINSGFSKIGSNEIIRPEDAAQIKTPFNWSVAGAVWEVLNPGLVQYILACSAQDSKEAISLSWELLFSDYNLMLGSDNLSEAEIIDNSNETKFKELDKLLKSNGGEGKTKDNIPVYRLIVGDMLPGGFAFTSTPAANIRGVLPITESDIIQPESIESIVVSATQDKTNSIDSIIDIVNVEEKEVSVAKIEEKQISIPKIERNSNNSEKNIKNIPTQEKNSVNNITENKISNKTKKNIYMKFKSKNDITADKFTSLASDQAAFVAEQINEFCDKFAADLDAKKLEVETAKANEKELKASIETANKLVADIQAKLDASELARASEKEKNDLSLRLNDLNTRFELSDKGSKAIAKQIKGLDDSKYSEWLDFAESTFAAKKAKKVKDAADDKDDDDSDDDMDDSKADYDDAEAAKKAKAKKAAKDKDAKASEDDFDFESVEAKKNQKILNGTSKDRNLTKDFAEAFAGLDKEFGLE